MTVFKSKQMFILFLIALTMIALVWGSQTTRAGYWAPRSATLAGGAINLGSEITISELDNSQFQPAVAYNWKHGEYLVVWENQWPGNQDIYAQRVNQKGEVLSGFYVPDDSTFTKQNRKQPDVAYDPVNDRYLVVWIYDTAGDGSNYDIHGRFIPWQGPDSNLPEFVINNWASSQWEPKVAYGRTPQEYVVVWMNTPTGVPRYISAQRVTAGGSGSLTGSTLTVSTGAEDRDNPDITYNVTQNQYLMTWDVDNGGSGTGWDVYGQRLHGGSDNFAGGEIGIAGWPGDEQNSRVAACSAMNKYLVVWQADAGGVGDIYARFVSADGSVATHTPLQLGGAVVDENNPEVACTESGDLFMAAWGYEYGGGLYRLGGQLIYANETAGEVFSIDDGISGSSSNNRWYPQIQGGYTNFLVTWEHERQGTSYQDIHGKLVTPYAVFLPLVMK